MFKTMKVTYIDGAEVECHGRRADVIRFERTYKMAGSAIFEDGIHTEYIWFFAWVALGRDGEERSFDDWMDSVETVDINPDKADEVPPTDPGGDSSL